MKNGKVVVKSNVLLESRYKISLLEMKVFLCLIAQIEPKDQEFKWYRIYLQDFMSKADLKGRSAYQGIRDACRKLRSRELVFPEDVGKETEVPYITGFLSSLKPFRWLPYVEVRFDPDLKPYLLHLKKNFTAYDIRNVMQCRSVHSIRIYQLLKQYEKIGKRTFEISELKEILGLKPSQYTQWINFKTKVIEPARKELKKHSDIYFTYKGNRKGRAFHSLTFIIKKQRQKRLFDTEPDGPLVPSYEEIMERQRELEQTPAGPYTPDP